MIAERPNGSTVSRMLSQRVAPSASAPSCRRRGVCSNTERVTAVMIGRIITASTRPAMIIVRPVADAGPLKNGIEAEVVLEPPQQPDGVRAEHGDAPEAVDDARDRRQEVDHVAHRLGDPARRDVADEQRDRDRHRDGDHDRDGRGHDRAEDQRPDELDQALAAGHVGGVRRQRGHGLHDQEQRDSGERGQDEHARGDRDGAKDAIANAAPLGPTANYGLQVVDRCGAHVSQLQCLVGGGLVAWRWRRRRAGSSTAPRR